jgi:ribosomal protein L29
MQLSAELEELRDRVKIKDNEIEKLKTEITNLKTLVEIESLKTELAHLKMQAAQENSKRQTKKK